MPTWLTPVVHWQDVDAADVRRLLADAGEPLMTWPPGPFERTPTFCYRTASEYRIWQPEVGGVVFTADRPVLLLQPLVGTDHRSFERLVSRSWLPAIYPIWNRQVLHASAVATPSGAVIAFTGPSGACKSTTAYALAQRPGWVLVADDTLVFEYPESSTARPVLHPLRSEARLRSATAEHFGTPDVEEVPFSWPSIPLHLRALYALDASTDQAARVVIEPLGAAEVFPVLLNQAHALSLRDADQNQRLMRDYLALAADVPAFRFTFPKTFGQLASSLDRLEAHAASLGAQPRGTATEDGLASTSVRP